MTFHSLFEALTTPAGTAAALALHILGVAGFAAYGLGQGHLLWFYFRRPPRGAAPPLPASPSAWPYVTVQLPMYNERYVAAAVIDACASLSWPRDRFELQILDDSVDDTVAIIDERAAHWRSRGVDVQVVRRAERTGYKAGALAHAAPLAKGDFHCLFDADFRPEPDFLERTMGWFADERVGAVQARWGHLNRTWSWLTRAQAVVLDAFFMVEQEARDRAGFFLRFNGSAGIWRARTVADAGGWQADTLSEDYDLCLRAQLRGWKFVYTRDVVAPAEVPVTVHDYKVQQTRWARGRGQVIRKLAPAIWRASLPPLVKFHALFDMFNILVVPAVLLVVASSPWVVLVVAAHPALVSLTGMIALLQAPLSLGVLPTYLWLALRPYASRSRPMHLELAAGVPSFLALMQGINLVVLSAGLSGLTGREVPFRRTSKYAITENDGSWRAKLYRPAEISGVTWAEGIVAACGIGALVLDVTFASWSWMPFHFVVTAGFSAMFGYSLVRS